MKLVSYSQDNGFRVVEFGTDWDDNEDRESWLKRAGFDHHAVDSTQYDEDDTFSVAIHLRSSDATHNWHALLCLESSLGCSSYVLVTDEAELIALMVALAPFALMAGISSLGTLREAAKRAFHAWHGHAYYYPCAECDPHAHAAEERRRRERAAAKNVQPPSGDPRS